MYPRRKGCGSVVVPILRGNGMTPLLRSGRSVGTTPAGSGLARLASVAFNPVRLATAMALVVPVMLSTKRFAGYALRKSRQLLESAFMPYPARTTVEEVRR